MIIEYEEHFYKEWLEMRIALWPDATVEEHEEEIEIILSGRTFEDEEGWKVYFVLENSQVIGFAELSIRSQLGGLIKEPLGYLEGWYIKEAFRQQGYGKALIQHAEKWFQSKDYKVMGSDVEFHNKISIKAHEKMGYQIISKNHEAHIFKKELV